MRTNDDVDAGTSQENAAGISESAHHLLAEGCLADVDDYKAARWECKSKTVRNRLTYRITSELSVSVGDFLR